MEKDEDNVIPTYLQLYNESRDLFFIDEDRGIGKWTLDEENFNISFITHICDDEAQSLYYQNVKSGIVTWELPSFSDSSIDHTVRNYVKMDTLSMQLEFGGVSFDVYRAELAMARVDKCLSRVSLSNLSEEEIKEVFNEEEKKSYSMSTSFLEENEEIDVEDTSIPMINSSFFTGKNLFMGLLPVWNKNQSIILI